MKSASIQNMLLTATEKGIAVDYSDKLTAIIQNNDIRSVTCGADGIAY